MRRADDPNDLTPWYYTAMLTGRGGDAGEMRAITVGVFDWLMSNDEDDLSWQNIRSENVRVRDWMCQRPSGAIYCFELTRFTRIWIGFCLK